MEKNFRLSSYATLHRLAQVRNSLMAQGASKNSLTYPELGIFHQKLFNIQTDQQMAKFITDNEKTILLLPPATHLETIEKLKELIKEAKSKLT